MASTATQLSAAGHLQTVTIDEPKGSGTAGETLAIQNVVYLKAADSKLWKPVNTEASVAAIVGISDGSYSADATAAYWQNGDVATGLSGLTAGTEYWCSSAGALVAYSSLSSSDWSRPMGVALSTTSLQVQIGDVVQKP